MLLLNKWILLMLFGLVQCVHCYAPYTWTASMICGTYNRLRIQHLSDEHYQRIDYLLEFNPSESILCSRDEVICMKNVHFEGAGCQNITWDFEVEFGNQWGKVYQLVLSPPYPTVISPEVNFTPYFYP